MPPANASQHRSDQEIEEKASSRGKSATTGKFGIGEGTYIINRVHEGRRFSRQANPYERD